MPRTDQAKKTTTCKKEDEIRAVGSGTFQRVLEGKKTGERATDSKSGGGGECPLSEISQENKTEVGKEKIYNRRSPVTHPANLCILGAGKLETIEVVENGPHRYPGKTGFSFSGS